MENPELIHRQPMDVMEAIYNRRAVRDYLPKKVDTAIIHQLLDAAIQAPSALHEESRAFVVIQNKHLLDRLSESAKLIITKEPKNNKDLQFAHVLETVQHKEFNVFYNAQTLIVVYSRFKGQHVNADCWLAAENIMLSALAYGLASCAIGFSIAALNLPEWKEELGVPKKMTAVAPIIIGWPAREVLPPPRQPPMILEWK